MIKTEVFEKMLNSENGGLYAAIGGIVLVYGIDRITKNHYKADVNKKTQYCNSSIEQPFPWQ